MTYSDIWTEGLATIRKALTSANSGSILLQPVVDAVIPMLADYQNPLRQNLPRKKGNGQSWIVNRRSPGSTPAEWVSDTDSATEDTGSYDQFLFPFRTLLTRGKVMRKLQATGASYIDVLMEEIEGKILEFKNYEDNTYITGVSSATVPEGIEYLCTGNQMVAATPTAGGGPLTLARIDEAMDLNIGNPDMMIMARRTRRELNALLQAQQQYIDVTEVKGGFRLMSYNGVPIYVSTNMPITQLYNGSTEGSNEGGSSSSIYFVDTNHLWAGELTPIRMVPMAKTTSQYDEFEIFCDEVLVLRNPLCISKLIGIWSGA
jgi:hypothetical protein